MAIKIKGKYTNPSFSDINWIKGLYDENETVIVLKSDGTIQNNKKIFLGYLGEDHVRAINFDTRQLAWNRFVGDENSTGEIADFYTPLVLFFNPTKPRLYYLRDKDGVILAQDGKLIVTEDGVEPTNEDLPNPIVVLAQNNFCFIPNEVTSNLVEYEIVYALIEKQNENDEDVGNISDCTICKNRESFVSDIIYGYVESSSKPLFDRYKDNNE